MTPGEPKTVQFCRGGAVGLKGTQVKEKISKERHAEYRCGEAITESGYHMWKRSTSLFVTPPQTNRTAFTHHDRTAPVTGAQTPSSSSSPFLPDATLQHLIAHTDARSLPSIASLQNHPIAKHFDIHHLSNRGATTTSTGMCSL